ncbi:MAG TPA: hypothetical protein VKX49_04460 [Bryobacteraceae bacterium]|nr:hypothetical protein [Bryobacteraceae bacterium]
MAAAPALAQLETDTITVAANRQVSLQPDQIVFSVQVSAPQTASIDDVLAKIAGTGLSAADLSSVYSGANG